MPTEETAAEGRDVELMDGEEELVERFRAKGYEHHFVLDGESVRCPECDETVPAKAVHVDETARFEGPSNPSDESVVFAISNGPCQHKGVLVTAYGMAAEGDNAEGLRVLGTEPARLEEDPITAREAAEQALIVEGDSDEGAELGDQMR